MVWKTIVATGGADKIGTTWPNGQFEYTLTLKIGEALKGNLNGIVDDLRPQFITWSDERYDQWMGAETSMLVAPRPDAGAGPATGLGLRAVGRAGSGRASLVGPETGAALFQRLPPSQGQRGSPSLRTGLRQTWPKVPDPSDSHPARLRSKERPVGRA